MLPVKVPQILKILHASSTAGLSFASSTMELMAITGSLVYGFAMGFPFRFAFVFHIGCTIEFLFGNMVISFFSFTVRNLVICF